jgi:VCBS repeat-containing protein
LVAGQQISDSFVVTAADDTSSNITVTITGTNDAAVISGTSTFDLTETNAVLTTSGTLTATDVDGVANTFIAETLFGNYGRLVMNATGAWVYTASSAQDQLASDVKVTDIFTVRAADGTAQAITVNITGTNDAAVISGTRTFALTETNAVLTTSGTLTSTDVDGIANAFIAETVTGTYGSLTMGANGAWTYTAASAQDQLASGALASDTFAVRAADGTATSITVNITGTNDAAVISGTRVAELTETNAILTTSGTLAATDVDGEANTFMAETVQGTFGILTMGANGAWTYASRTAQNQLAQDAKATDVFTVHAADGTASSITVNITGTNDAPVISVVTPVPGTTATLEPDGTIKLTYLEGTAVPLAAGGVSQSFLNLFKFQATDIDGPTSAITYQFGSPANLNDHSSYFEIVDVANEDYFYLAVNRLGSQSIAATTDSLNFNLWAKDAFIQSFTSEQLVDITYQKAVSANGTSAFLPGAIGDWAISPLGTVDADGIARGNGFNAISLIDASLVIALPSTVTELSFGDNSKLTLSNLSVTQDAYNNIFAKIVDDSIGTQTITVQDTTVSTQIELKAAGNHTVVGAPDAFGDPGLGYVENLRTDTIKLSDANFAQAKFTILNDDLANTGFKDGHSVKVDLQSPTNAQTTIGTLKIDDIEYIEFQDKKVTLIGADIPRNEDTVIEINANGDYVIIGSTDTLAGAVNARHDSLDVVMQSNQSPLASFTTTTDGNVQMVLRDKTSNAVLGTSLMRDIESVQFIYKNANGDRTELDNIVIVAGGGYATLTDAQSRHTLNDPNTFIYNPSSSYGNDVYHY